MKGFFRRFMVIALALAICGGIESARALPSWAAGSAAPPAVEARQAVTYLVLKLDERKLIVMVTDGEVTAEYRSFPVGIGRSGFETPRGEFTVFEKIVDPVWQHPFDPGIVIPAGPHNPLGRRWIGFATHGRQRFGIHGTNDESTVGRAVSLGCIRMKNAHVDEVFSLVDVGTKVFVQ
jgi:L,D-transpeptidase ErfK/SrfK